MSVEIGPNEIAGDATADHVAALVSRDEAIAPLVPVEAVVATSSNEAIGPVASNQIVVSRHSEHSVTVVRSDEAVDVDEGVGRPGV